MAGRGAGTLPPMTDDATPYPEPPADADAAWLPRLAGRTVRTTLPGGDLEIAWRPDGRVDMTGPAVESFRGTYAPS